MKDFYVYTQTLTEHGAGVARATFEVIDGKGEHKAVEDARTKALSYCKEGLARLEKAQAENKHAAFQTWSLTAVDYARWECAQAQKICDELLRRLDDTAGTADARKLAIVQWITPLDRLERERKAQIEAATEKFYAALNGAPP